MGDKILALKGMDGVFKGTKASFATVTGLTHGPSIEDFVEIGMKRAPALGSLIRATPHHTFPSCSGKVFKAKDLRPGHCLVTKHGKDIVRSAKHVPKRVGDFTYTIQVDESYSSIMIGGIFTHAKSVGHSHKALRGGEKNQKSPVKA